MKPRTRKSGRIFFSHSTLNAELARRITSLIEQGVGVPFSDIFVTSGPGQGIQPGESGNNRIYDELQTTPISIALFTPDYLQSTYCMCELGAIWARAIPFAPLLAPPMTYHLLPGPVHGRQALRLDTAVDLDSLREFILQNRGGSAVPVSRWNAQKEEFISELPAFYRRFDDTARRNRDFLYGLDNMPHNLSKWLEFFSEKIGTTLHLWVLILDVDAQKNINKEYGVEIGNSVLSCFHNIINGLRAAPFFALNQGRCGDDTFYAIFIGTEEKAKELGADILSSVKKIPSDFLYLFNYAGSTEAEKQRASEKIKSLWVTASIGIARYPIERLRGIQSIDLAKTWVQSAYKACVVARQAGGGRVEIGDDFEAYRDWS